jgi:SAM-dependent methyltransferase
MPDRDLHEANRDSWNSATAAHLSHKSGLAKFLREGGSTLFPEELELLGDIRGLRLVHLQCNAGPDTLSLARRGADALGVDISDTAIASARRLAQDTEIPARFERGDVYDWLEGAQKKADRYDLAFASYGALPWLSDLERWAQGVRGVLAPGGRLVVVEFHPVMLMYDQQLARKFAYSKHGEPNVWAGGVDDYVANAREMLVPWGYAEGVRDFRNGSPCYDYSWSLAEILGAVLRAGLRIDRFEEYAFSNGYRAFDSMRRGEGGRWLLPEGEPELPLMYGLVASAPGAATASR